MPGERPLDYAIRLAIEKAVAVTRTLPAPSIALGADTIVVCDGRVYGKPADRAEAVSTLEALTGRNHTVFTAWALVPSTTPEAGATGYARSVVRMREASRAEIVAYVESGEPMDKAGAYAAQGEGRRFVAAITGPVDNVIGLPLVPVERALGEYGLVPAAVARV